MLNNAFASILRVKNSVGPFKAALGSGPNIITIIDIFTTSPVAELREEKSLLMTNTDADF